MGLTMNLPFTRKTTTQEPYPAEQISRRASQVGGAALALTVKHACAILTIGLLAVSAGTADAGISSPPTLHMVCEGSGRATVVFFSGAGDPLAIWQKIETHRPPGARVCAYDRSGEGKSPPTHGPQTLADMAAARHKTLRAHHVKGPLVLVAHSLGGGIAVTYAARYPAAIRSVVLLDATPADFARRSVRLIPATATGLAGLFREESLSFLDWRKNAEHLDGAQAFPQLGRIRRLALGIHLRVLAHGISFAAAVPQYGSALDKLWGAGQRHWAKLVRHTKVDIVPHSGHYIFQDAPELVIRVIVAQVKYATR